LIYDQNIHILSSFRIRGPRFEFYLLPHHSGLVDFKNRKTEIRKREVSVYRFIIPFSVFPKTKKQKYGTHFFMFFRFSKNRKSKLWSDTRTLHTTYVGIYACSSNTSTAGSLTVRRDVIYGQYTIVTFGGRDRTCQPKIQVHIMNSDILYCTYIISPNSFDRLLLQDHSFGKTFLYMVHTCRVKDYFRRKGFHAVVTLVQFISSVYPHMSQNKNSSGNTGSNSTFVTSEHSHVCYHVILLEDFIHWTHLYCVYGHWYVWPFYPWLLYSNVLTCQSCMVCHTKAPTVFVYVLWPNVPQ
jgi:hypothetical protein